jgi:hypothetical protein
LFFALTGIGYWEKFFGGISRFLNVSKEH